MALGEADLGKNGQTERQEEGGAARAGQRQTLLRQCGGTGHIADVVRRLAGLQKREGDPERITEVAGQR